MCVSFLVAHGQHPLLDLQRQKVCLSRTLRKLASFAHPMLHHRCAQHRAPAFQLVGGDAGGEGALLGSLKKESLQSKAERKGESRDLEGLSAMTCHQRDRHRNGDQGKRHAYEKRKLLSAQPSHDSQS